jgi:hypothetical protein
MVFLLDKINRKLSKNRRKTLGLYNNLIAGIITGAFVGSSLPYFIKFLLNLEIMNLIIYSLIMVIVGIIYYWLGLLAVRHSSKDKTEDWNYKSNFLAGFIASLVSSIILTLQLKFLFFIPLLIVLLIVIIYKFAGIKR